MSIIEKALDKALGRVEEPIAAKDEPVEEHVAEPTVESQPVSDHTVIPESSPPPRAEAEEPDERPVHELDWRGLQAQGFLADLSVDSPIAEAYRRIARPVLFNAFPDGNFRLQRANLVLVTSSRSGEGKTFTAVNLALSIAAGQVGRKVLLIDADTAKSSVSSVFGLADRAGLTDLLDNTKRQLLRDTVLKTDLPNLQVLPVGLARQKAPGLLAGATMMKLAKDLSALYPNQLVIFDGPSLLEMEDTTHLATQVGQVLLVVESEMTPQVIVEEAVAKLEFCNVVGCILNKSAERRTSVDLSSGYGMYHPEDSEG